jgi:glycosyltransferase involved in cell wall biosynthesis
LLVVASTYPRWAGDYEPGFVHELAKRMAPAFAVTALGPHAPGALASEVLDGVQVCRFRYAPAFMETLVNDGGLVTNLRRQPWKVLLVPFFIGAMALAMRRELRRGSFDVVHAHWIIPQGLVYLLASTGRRRPLVVTSHGADLFALRGRAAAWLRAWVCARATAVTVVSSAMKNRLVDEGIPSDKVSTESMGVDLRQRFTPDVAIPRSDSELLFVGRLVEKKGLHVLLEAMPTILAARPDVRLTVAGFGPELSPLRARARALGIDGSVDFLGPVEQASLPALYRRAAVFVAPFVEAASGDQEGLGLVCLEASGCGCPVVISDLPATRDVFDARIPPNSPPLLAAAVASMLGLAADERAGRAAAQRDKLLEHYDWEAVASRYRAILAKAARGDA